MNIPPVNRDRLLASIAEMAEIGATPKGGVRRLALTDVDRRGRDLFVRWAEAAGCTITVDKIGNIFARRAGRDDSLAPVIAGSHLDSQPSGGKYDGAYGVLAALEVLRVLEDTGIVTQRPIEAVSWTNEEGSRFPPAMMGSGVYVGALPMDEVLATEDLDGTNVAAALADIGYAGEAACGGRDIHAYFEAHIEQGPILEAEDKVIGVVEGIQGIKWFDCRITGQDSHAGPTPMHTRKDALIGAAQMVEAVNAVALDHGPDGRGTVGQFVVEPNSRNVVPGAVELTIDIRHPEAYALDSMSKALRERCTDVCKSLGLDGTLDEIWYSPPTPFEASCVAAVEAAAQQMDASYRRITSGAGHDAKYMADVCPTGMVFIPCKDGISHNEIEDAHPDHLTAGCQVLLQAIVEKANEG